uniref:Uncharacterized protein n=1 Tax=Mesocestoides corti TaxID=53468 RepID=A0A5K3FMT8_MESCO
MDNSAEQQWTCEFTAYCLYRSCVVSPDLRRFLPLIGGGGQHCYITLSHPITCLCTKGVVAYWLISWMKQFEPLEMRKKKQLLNLRAARILDEAAVSVSYSRAGVKKGGCLPTGNRQKWPLSHTPPPVRTVFGWRRTNGPPRHTHLRPHWPEPTPREPYLS